MNFNVDVMQRDQIWSLQFQTEVEEFRCMANYDSMLVLPISESDGRIRRCMQFQLAASSGKAYIHGASPGCKVTADQENNGRCTSLFVEYFQRQYCLL